MKDFDVTNKKYRGLNAFSEVTSLSQGDLRQATNVDLFKGEQTDSIQNRRGSTLLDAETTAYADFLRNKTVFAVGDDEYLITNVNDEFYAQQVSPSVTSPTVIRSSVLVIAVTGDHLGSPVLNGLNSSNTDDFVLYLDLIKFGGSYTIRLFKDPARTLLVASGSISDATMLPAPITITQQNSSGISGSVSLLSDPGSPAKTGDVGYSPWDAGSLTNDMKNAAQKVFCFSQDGNSVISWNEDEGRFQARPMGLLAPTINSIDFASPGDMVDGELCTWGIEKVIQKDDADIVASSPNRRFPNGNIVTFNVLDAGGARLVLVDSSIEDDPYWTHLRLWRSKNQSPNLVDPLFPIDAQGVPSQLYEVALITREEIFGTLAPIATGLNLPAGNVGVEAGVDSGDYVIRDTNDDSVLVDFVDLDRIDLIPLPAARTGAVHAGRVFVSGIRQADIDQDLIEDVLYTTEIYSAYQEQWDAQAFLNAGRNSFKTTMLQTFNDDLLIIREGETKRIPSGNVDAGIQVVDDKIGVQSFLMAGFVTGLGIAAVCSDRYFRYFGFDYKWHSNVSGVEASNAIYPFTKIQAANAASFAYINGKLLMLLIDVASENDYGFFALHVKEGKGWTKYEYLVEDLVCLFNFSDGLRAGIIPSESKVVEIEVDTDTDWDGEALVKVAGTLEFAPVKPESGLLDVSQFSFWGKLTESANVTAKSSGIEWQVLPTFEQPGLWAAESSLNEREYIFKPQPQTVGVFKWVPLRGNFISFVLSTSGQFFLAWNRTKGTVRETLGNLGVFQTGGIIPQGPGWASPSMLLLNFEDPATTFYDASGRQRNYEWGGTGTKTNRVTQKPGKGLRMASGGYVEIETDDVSPYIGVSSLTFKAVVSLDQFGSAIFSGRVGGRYYELRLVVFGSTGSGAKMTIRDGETVRAYFSDVAILTDTPTVVTFVLGSDFSGQFYCDAVSASSFAGKRVTVPASGIGFTPIPSGASASLFTNLVLGGAYANQPLFGILEQATQFWRLYLSESDRDAQTNPVGFFAGPPSGNTFTFTAQNGSGITGSVDTDGDFPVGPENLDVVLSGPEPVEGGKIEITGVVSYYEVIKSGLQTQQAKRFWGIVKAY